MDKFGAEPILSLPDKCPVIILTYHTRSDKIKYVLTGEVTRWNMHMAAEETDGKYARLEK